MKILPNYLIEFMPEIEEAMEELRLSILDHAYELLNCLDINELSSDDIRNKLELFDIRIENMKESWLPNGRFYQIYPYIKHNRTRLNAITSIVKSGGQFEGLWSTNFRKTQVYNYHKIQLVRHYDIASAMDGYFYVSGDAYRNPDGSIASSALVALQSDILLNGALPAGYTYLYVPWPRPHYPSDTSYFYNVNSLLHDRLYYAKHCKEYYSNKQYNAIDLDKPASYALYKDEHGKVSDSSINKYRYISPFWFDYHYIDGYTLQPEKDRDRYNYIDECGKFVDVDGNIITDPNDANKMVKYVANDGCEYNFNKLNDSNALFPTNCYMLFVGKTTSPDRHQVSKYLQYKIIDDIYHESYIGLDEHGYEEYNKVPPIDEPFGPYRNDALISTYAFRRRTSFNHIKTYRPVWSEMSPTFALAQSDINRTPSHYSFLNWFNRKQNENIISPYANYITDASGNKHYTTIRYNDPDITEITHTSYDVPTYSKLDKIYIGYTVKASDQDKQQGDNNSISKDDITKNGLYFYNESHMDYDPEYSYTLMNANYIDENGTQVSFGDPKLYIEISPSMRELYLNAKYSDLSYAYNYITYKRSNVHQLWFSPDKSTVPVSGYKNVMYNHTGSSEIYYFTKNNRSFLYNIIGVYTSNGNKVNYKSFNIGCYYITETVGNDTITKYVVHSTKLLDEHNNTLEASYVLFTLKIIDGSVPEGVYELVKVFKQETNSYIENCIYNQSTNKISLDNGITYITVEQLHGMGYIIYDDNKVIDLFAGTKSVELHFDDSEK